jgi:hypothetical protein
MAEHLHDGVQLCTALGELSADGVAEAMGRDGGPAVDVHQPCRLAGQSQSSVEQVVIREGLAVVNK